MTENVPTIERPRISAFMITFNNERTVEAALQSLTWADEIVVIDSFSTDRTPEIARKYAQKFEQRDWPGFRDQYQYAADQCGHDWVIFADADEVVPPELAAEIQQELADNQVRPEPSRIAGYFAPRRTWYMERWIMHGEWVPDREIRIYNRQLGQFKGGLHANVHIDGSTATLSNFYRHYTYANIGDHLKTIDRYSDAAAEEMDLAGKRFSWVKLIGNPPVRFLRSYLFKLGFLDGLAGVVIAASSAYYVFVKQAKLWEVQRQKRENRE